MIGCDEMQLGALEPEQFLPKIVGESGISIRNNRRRHVMKLEDMSILGKMINNHHDD